ncbi:MAG TPA: hypothetical protein VHL58_07245 [Thermoanaerobaculia bacterium]|nr:hypothetical protein [Thermoanaerobaculia bacterium]
MPPASCRPRVIGHRAIFGVSKGIAVKNDSLESLDAVILVPGHGPILEGTVKISREIGRIRDILMKAIETGATPTAS